MKNWKTAIGLVVVLLALSAVATWDEWQTKKDEKTKETSNQFVNFKVEDVKAFVFHTAGDADTGGDKEPAKAEPVKSVDVSAQLVDGKWQITSPITAPADQQVVQDLIKSIADYKYEKEIVSGKDQWAQFGLTTPRRRIEFEMKDGSKLAIYVGINAPVGFSTYVATDKSETVYAGSQYIATSLAKTLFDFRDKKLLTIGSADVDSARLQFGADKPIELIRKDGKWQVTAPEAVEADTTQVNNFLDDATGLRAIEFFDVPSKEQKDAFAANKTFAVIELKGEKSGSTLLKLAKAKDGSLMASLDPNRQIVKVGDDAKTKFSKSLNDLRSKKIFDFQSAQVEGVDIDGSSFVRVKDDWYTKDDAAKFGKDGNFAGKEEDKPKAQAHVRGLLVDLEYAKSEAVHEANSDVAKNLPKTPKNKIVIHLAAGGSSKGPITIDAWQTAANPEEIYLRTSSVTGKIFKAKKSIIASTSSAPALPAEDASFQPNKEMPAGLPNMGQ